MSDSWQAWYNGLPRGQKIQYHFFHKWEKVIDLLLENKTGTRVLDSKLFDRFESGLKRLMCFLFKHDIIPDMCGNPEHDYCVWCTRNFPHRAKRKTE